MEKYRLVEERKVVPDEVLPNEVRITQQGKPRNYISYSVNLFVSIQIPHLLILLFIFSQKEQIKLY